MFPITYDNSLFPSWLCVQCARAIMNWPCLICADSHSEWITSSLMICFSARGYSGVILVLYRTLVRRSKRLATALQSKTSNFLMNPPDKLHVVFFISPTCNHRFLLKTNQSLKQLSRVWGEILRDHHNLQETKFRILESKMTGQHHKQQLSGPETSAGKKKLCYRISNSQIPFRDRPTSSVA